MKKVILKAEVTVYEAGDTIPANKDVADRAGRWYRWDHNTVAERTFVVGLSPFHNAFDSVAREARQHGEDPREPDEEERLQGEINDVLLLLAKRNFMVTRSRSLVSQVNDALDEVMSKRNKIARESADLHDQFATARINWEREKESLLEEIEEYKELLKSIWLYVNWHYVTKQLTTEQKGMWADAVDEKGDPEDRGNTAERWWEH